MIGYNNKDMSIAKTGLAEYWETSEDGLTWTFNIRDGVKWSDGEPLTAADIAYTYNRIIDGGPESATWGAYLQQVDTITAPDAKTVVLSMKKPNSSLPLLPIPIVPEHIWKDVSEKEVKTYKAEPEDGQPVVGSGPFRLVEGSAGGSTYKFEANPDYWQGAPNIDEVVFRVYKSDDPAIQALIKGEVDFVDGITPVQVKALQGKPGITAQNGDVPGLRRDRVQHRLRSTPRPASRSATATPPCSTRRSARARLRDRPRPDHRARSTRAPACRAPRSSRRPTTTSTGSRRPTRPSPTTRRRPKRAARRGRLHGRRRRLPQPCRTATRSAPCGSSPARTRRLSLHTMDFFQEWLDDLGIKAEVTAIESNNLTDIILEGDFDAFQWGWYVEPDPSSMLDYMTCDQLGNWSDSWYCNDEYDAMYKQQQTELDPEARAEMVKQMQQMLYEDSPYLVTAYKTVGEAFRSDRFACLVPQPDPGGVWLFQYGVYNYVHMRPADEAGDCGGDKSATAGDRGRQRQASAPACWSGSAWRRAWWSSLAAS